jgi:hypothetical protein
MCQVAQLEHHELAQEKEQHHMEEKYLNAIPIGH